MRVDSEGEHYKKAFTIVSSEMKHTVHRNRKNRMDRRYLYEMDKLAQEDHHYVATKAERARLSVTPPTTRLLRITEVILKNHSHIFTKPDKQHSIAEKK